MMTGGGPPASHGGLNSTFSSAPPSSSSASSAPSTSAHEGNNVQVIVRCRPPTESERRGGDVGVIGCLNGNEVHVLAGSGKAKAALGGGGKKVYTFDQSYGALSSQEEVYTKAVKPLVDEVLAGFNCTVFAYGQTGTGKTYTMEGELTSASGSKHAGVIPRSIHSIFDVLEHQSLEYSVKVSFLELYNEELTDLLAEEESGMEDGGHRELRIFEDTSGKRGMLVNNLEEVIVTSAEEVFTALQKSWQKRRTAETLLNKNSSRSHCVFIITVHTKECDEDGEDIIKTGKLYLVDLAGSECVGKSGAQNQRAKEAGKINQSLLTLGRVINALVDKASYIPYRDSKLTRLLQESLGGRAKTVIIATVSPSVQALDETLSTLEYAHRAKNIRNRPQVNQKMSKRQYMKDLLAEINSLKRDNEALRLKNGIFLPPEKYELMMSQQKGDSLRLEELFFAVKAKEAEAEQLAAALQEKDAGLQAVTAEKAMTAQHLQSALESLSHSEAALQSTTGRLQATTASLTTTSQLLSEERVKVEEGSALLAAHQRTEAALSAQAAQLVRTVEGVVEEKERLHEKVARKEDAERQNAQSVQRLARSVGQQRRALDEDAERFAASFEATQRSAGRRVGAIAESTQAAASSLEAQSREWSAAWRVQKEEMGLKADAFAASSQRGFDEFHREAELSEEELHLQLQDAEEEAQQGLQRVHRGREAEERLFTAVSERSGRFLSAASESTTAFEASTAASLAALSTSASARLYDSAESSEASLAFLASFVAAQEEQRSQLRTSLLSAVQRWMEDAERQQREQLLTAVAQLTQRLQAQRQTTLALRSDVQSSGQRMTEELRSWAEGARLRATEETAEVARTADEWKGLRADTATELESVQQRLTSSVSGLQSRLAEEVERSRQRAGQWSASLQSFHADQAQHAQHLDGLQASAAAQQRGVVEQLQRQQLLDTAGLTQELSELQGAVASHVSTTLGHSAALHLSVSTFQSSEFRTDGPTGRTPEKRKLHFLTQFAATPPHSQLLEELRAAKKKRRDGSGGAAAQSTEATTSATPSAALDVSLASVHCSSDDSPVQGGSASRPSSGGAQSHSPPIPPPSHVRQLSASSALSARDSSASAAPSGPQSSIPVLSLRSSSRVNGASAVAAAGGGAGSENTPPSAADAAPPSSKASASFVPSLSKPTLRSASRIRFGPAAQPSQPPAAAHSAGGHQDSDLAVDS